MKTSSMGEQFKTQVFQREGDPFIYLYVNQQWYCYNPQEAPLGAGAMGTVYLGFSCSTNERIAIKRVKDEYANNKMIRERARQEASLSFSHPYLVKMIGLCEYEPDRGPIFILSQYVNGITLDKHVKEQLRDFSQTEKVEKISMDMCNVLDALHYLHSRGIVHRDVKPSNIMLENGNTVKLMDLGIARMNGGNNYSRFGFIGTPQYAAPEQILRDKNHMELTARTDIYALGVTFYELLTGVNPFCSDIEAEVLSRQVTKPLPYNNLIPKRLFKVIRKATEKEADKRYTTALEFKKAILEALSAIPPQISWNALIMWVIGILFMIAIIIIIFII